MNWVGDFLDFLDNRSVFRRAAFVIVLAGTVKLTDWSMSFADHWLASGKSGVDAGALLAAVTAPFAALQAAVLKFYIDGRNKP